MVGSRRKKRQTGVYECGNESCGDKINFNLPRGLARVNLYNIFQCANGFIDMSTVVTKRLGRAFHKSGITLTYLALGIPGNPGPKTGLC